MLRRCTHYVCASRRSIALSVGVLRRLGGSSNSSTHAIRLHRLSRRAVIAARENIERARRDGSMLDYGWSEDGSALWIECQVNDANRKRGVVRVPAAIRGQLSAAA